MSLEVQYTDLEDDKGNMAWRLFAGYTADGPQMVTRIGFARSQDAELARRAMAEHGLGSMQEIDAAVGLRGGQAVMDQCHKVMIEAMQW